MRDSMPPLVLLLIVVSAGLAIYGEEAQPPRRRLVYLFKPLTTIVILGVALALGSIAPTVYAVGIVVGLVCSLAGDIFLMLPQDRFLPGLVAFLLAHLAYLWAFTRLVPFGASPAVFLGVAAVEAAIVWILWRGVPVRMRLPVIAYVAVLGLMVAQSLSQAITLSTRPAWMAALGGVLFLLSDSTLAFDRFRRRFRGARLLVLTTYWGAQTLFAVSVLLPLSLNPHLLVL
jgi:uncharacterized membrane protein YhhN